MNILLVHNFYQYPGGEDEVFKAEARLLLDHGHKVECYTAHNDAVEEMNRWQLGRIAIWNNSSYAAIRRRVQETGAQLVHFHNTVPLISPAGYYAAQSQGVAVVQTLHNYRFTCPAATLYRQGAICRSCIGLAFPWPAIWHKCYRGSTVASGAVSVMLAAHKLAQTWTQQVNTYVVPTYFARDVLVSAGIPAEKLTVKPHFVSTDYGAGQGEGGYALFLGRLSEEKGVRTLLRTWKNYRPSMPLKIAGDGPLRAEVTSAAADGTGVEYVGFKDHSQSVSLLKDAMVTIVPSECYETFGKTIIESYACGTPVVASSHGASAELVHHGKTGFLFPVKGSAELRDVVERIGNEKSLRDRLRANARVQYQQKYTSKQNIKIIEQIYKLALERNSHAGTPPKAN
jgi:glycosyltransferase involved in cell wall biosynthesis